MQVTPELPVRADAMAFMAVDAPPGTQDIRLVFEKPLGKSGWRRDHAGLAILFCCLLARAFSRGALEAGRLR